MTVTAGGVAGRRSGARASRPHPARAGAGERLSRADRAAQGKQARTPALLDSHAEFAAGKSRDPVGLLLEQAKSHVPELVPVRHGRMLVSPFTFYRGAALPMAAGGPGRNSRLRAAGAAVRGCPPVQFRGVRLAGAAAGLRCQRFRRDPARPVRVGRQAAGRQPGGGGTDNGSPAKTRRKIVLAAAERYRTAMRAVHNPGQPDSHGASTRRSTSTPASAGPGCTARSRAPAGPSVHRADLCRPMKGCRLHEHRP
jgi:hypothetical protein